jgi:hypothetical protein
MAMTGTRRENVFVLLEASVSMEELILDGSKLAATPFEFETSPGRLDEKRPAKENKRDSHCPR